MELLIGAVIGIFIDEGWNRLKLTIVKRRIYNWLKNNTSRKSGYHFRSTRAIANGTGTPPSKVIEACYASSKIRRNTKEKESWTIYLDSKDDENNFIAEIWT